MFAQHAVSGDGPDGRTSWARLARAVALSTIGGVGMWSVVVSLPAVSAEFGVARSAAALPYTLAMIGFAFAGVAMGWLADKFGVAVPTLIGAVLLAVGYVAASSATSLTGFALAHWLLIGVGSSASFAPLMADISLWFVRRRGIAVAICASGNYLAGTLWPPIVQRLVEAYGWRTTHLIIAAVVASTMLPLVASLRRRPGFGIEPGPSGARGAPQPLALTPNAMQALLVVAGLACCVAMAMPQVHIVAYCGDLGYGAARGAEMLALMMASGIISRIASGFIADRIGGLATLLLGSVLQGVALFLFLLFDGLGQLFVVSALFGLFQGGIVPSYAIIVREYFPANEAGTRVSLIIMSTLFGMALGGWLSGVIFDRTGSYAAAFVNGLAWNLVNGAIVLFLLVRGRGRSDVRREPAIA
ncbi:MAG TPA: MFS transporter [Enterovirga sp.]